MTTTAPTRLPRETRVVAAGLPTVLALAACAGAPAPPAASPPPTSTAPSAELARYYDHEPAFGSCVEFAMTPDEQTVFAARTEAECARIPVPLDYTDPDGETAEIALLRYPARGEKLGSLLINTGGPGGTALLQAVVTGRVLAESPITERFDIVGFDPRGVGASTPAVSCFTDAEFDAGRAATTLIGREGQWTEDDTGELVADCAAGSGGEQMLAAVGTRDAAQDLDVLRAVLGDEQLTYLGQSYGTRLGAVYAEMFPAQVRAMVLDGAADPLLGTAERRVTQYAGFQRGFDQMAAACAAAADCPLGSDPAQAVEVFQSIVRPLIDTPITTSSGRPLDYNGATGAVITGLYSSAQWPDIWAGIAELTQGRGDALLALSDGFAGRGSDGRWNNFSEANYAINCMDEQRNTPEQEAELREQLLAAAPFLDHGTGVAGSRDACEFWPVDPTLGFPYAQDIDGLAPTLTISITGDPSTPYDAGISLAESLGGALLTVEGEQHTVAMSGASPCVNDVVAAYLIDLQTPDPDTTCRL